MRQKPDACSYSMALLHMSIIPRAMCGFRVIQHQVAATQHHILVCCKTDRQKHLFDTRQQEGVQPGVAGVDGQAGDVLEEAGAQPPLPVVQERDGGRQQEVVALPAEDQTGSCFDASCNVKPQFMSPAPPLLPCDSHRQKASICSTSGTWSLNPKPWHLHPLAEQAAKTRRLRIK